MSENIIKFRPRDYIDKPDNLLDEAKGNYKTLVLIGWNAEDEFDARATVSDGGELLWLIESFKTKLMNGDFGE